MDINKSRFSIKAVGCYLRELSIVVIGVAITLALTNYLSIRSERKDTKLYLNAIKLELEENMLDFDMIKTAMEKEMNYSRYILTHNKESLNSDTIKSYADVCYEIRNYIYISNAFEMLKASGNMRHVRQRNDAIYLVGLYLLEYAQEWS